MCALLVWSRYTNKSSDLTPVHSRNSLQRSIAFSLRHRDPKSLHSGYIGSAWILRGSGVHSPPLLPQRGESSITCSIVASSLTHISECLLPITDRDRIRFSLSLTAQVPTFLSLCRIPIWFQRITDRGDCECLNQTTGGKGSVSRHMQVQTPTHTNLCDASPRVDRRCQTPRTFLYLGSHRGRALPPSTLPSKSTSILTDLHDWLKRIPIVDCPAVV